MAAKINLTKEQENWLIENADTPVKDFEVNKIYKISEKLKDNKKYELVGKYKLLKIYPNHLMFENILNGCKECFIYHKYMYKFEVI